MTPDLHNAKTFLASDIVSCDLQ